MPTSAEIFQKYAKLPEAVKKVVFSLTTADRIFELGQKHGLQIDEIGLMSDEIGLVLLGEKRAQDFVANLSKALNISRDKAYSIAQDINHSIFFEIREQLKAIHGISQSAALIPDTPGAIESVSAIPSATKPVERSTPLAVNVNAAPVHRPEPKSPQVIPSPKIPSIVQNAPSMPPAPPVSVKIEPGLEAPIKTASSSVPQKSAALPAIAADSRNKKSNLHEEVHRLLAEHFEATTAVPVSSPQNPVIAPSLKIPAASSAPSNETPSSKTVPLTSFQTIMPPAPQKASAPTYQSKDPYREPVDD